MSRRPAASFFCFFKDGHYRPELGQKNSIPADRDDVELNLLQEIQDELLMDALGLYDQVSLEVQHFPAGCFFLKIFLVWAIILLSKCCLIQRLLLL